MATSVDSGVTIRQHPLPPPQSTNGSSSSSSAASDEVRGAMHKAVMQIPVQTPMHNAVMTSDIRHITTEHVIALELQNFFFAATGTTTATTRLYTTGV